MIPSLATITSQTEIAGPPAAVFRHWLDPESRQRWEAPPESGMRYLNFAGQVGETEVIEISHDGEVIGRMDQVLTLCNAPNLVASQITGTFHGATTMLMQVVMRFEETANGTAITGVSQVIDLTGRDVKAEHEAGWAGLYAAFARDYATHGGAA